MLGRNREEFSLKHFLCHSIKTLDPTVSTLQKIPKKTPLPLPHPSRSFPFSVQTRGVGSSPALPLHQALS